MATTQPFDNDFFAVLKNLPGVTVLSHLSPTAANTRADLSPESDDSDDEVKYTADEMNTYREIMLILESVRMEFFWNNETYLLQAALPSDWERLKLWGDGRLYSYRTQPFPLFISIYNKVSAFPIVRLPGKPNLFHMDYKNRVRVDLKQKGVKLLVRDRWDGRDGPWARRHFFDVAEWGARTYMMMKNTIEMGWLTWNKEKKMLWGTALAWKRHEKDPQIQVWKGVPFPDFLSWAFILHQPVDVSAFIEYDFLAPSLAEVYENINGTWPEKIAILDAQAPLVFGLGTTNRVAKRMYSAMRKYKYEMYQVYMVLSQPRIKFDPVTLNLIGLDAAWDEVHEYKDGYVGFDGATWKDKRAPLFNKGLYYFEAIIAPLAEWAWLKTRIDQHKRWAEELKPALASKDKKTLERYRKEISYFEDRCAKIERKKTKSEKTAEKKPMRKKPVERKPSDGRKSPPLVEIPQAPPSCSRCHMIAPEECPKCHHPFIHSGARELSESQFQRYDGMPTIATQIDLLFEPTDPHTLHLIREDFKLLRGVRHGRYYYSMLEVFDFEQASVDYELAHGKLIERPVKGKLRLCESPFDVDSPSYVANNALGNGFYVGARDFSDIYDAGIIPGLRKMVAYAGERGKSELSAYFNALGMEIEDRDEPEFFEFLDDLDRDLTDKESYKYRVVDNTCGYEAQNDMGMGLFLLNNDVPEEFMPWLRKWVADNGIAARNRSQRKLESVGIQMVNKIALPENSAKAILYMLETASTVYERDLLMQLYCSETADQTIMELQDYDGGRIWRENSAITASMLSTGYSNQYDLGSKIGLKSRGPGWKIDLKWRESLRKVVYINGPCRVGREISMDYLVAKEIPFVDMVERAREKTKEAEKDALAEKIKELTLSGQPLPTWAKNL